MTYAGKDFMEEVECICLKFSIWIETDNTYLKVSLKALGLDENLRSVLMETINIPKTQF